MEGLTGCGCPPPACDQARSVHAAIASDVGPAAGDEYHRCDVVRTSRRHAPRIGAARSVPVCQNAGRLGDAMRFRYQKGDATHPPITEAEAEVYRAGNLQTALAGGFATARSDHRAREARPQTETLRRHAAQRDWDSTSSELRDRCTVGGKVLPGLIVRHAVAACSLLRSG